MLMSRALELAGLGRDIKVLEHGYQLNMWEQIATLWETSLEFRAPGMALG